MRYVIRKLYKRDSKTGDLHMATVVLLGACATKKLQGKVGTPDEDSNYIIEFPINGRLTAIIEPGATFHISPME